MSASSGLLLDAQSRVWQTSNGGRTWSEVLSTGSSGATSLAFADPQHGFMTIDSFGGDSATHTCCAPLTAAQRGIRS